MMTGVRNWLLSGLTAGVVCAMAESLMPRGPVRVVGRLACGLVLACVFLAPLAQVELPEGERWLEEYFEELDLLETQLGADAGRELKAIIEGECAAYIVDKAAQLGITCQAQVVCEPDENGLPVPWKVGITGELTREEKESLARVVEGDLEIPRVRQEFYREEAVA